MNAYTSPAINLPASKTTGGFSASSDFCKSCGNKLDPQQKFCSKCGYAK